MVSTVHIVKYLACMGKYSTEKPQGASIGGCRPGHTRAMPG